MNGPPLPVPSPSVRFHPFGNGGVLHLSGSSRIWALNAMSALVWCLLHEAVDRQALVLRVSRAFRTSRQKASQDVEAALNGFRQAGLFSADDLLETGSGAQEPAETGPALVEPCRWALTRYFRAADHRFEFRCQNRSLGLEFSRYMAHLGCPPQNQCDSRLAVVPAERAAETWEIYLDGCLFKPGLRRNQVIPYLATLFFVRACGSLDEYLLLHAAVVQKNGKTLVLPGATGSGKSTLTAAMVQQGGLFFSDELAVLDTDTLCVSPFPLPMSIKAGSVRPLSQFYPGLSRRLVHLRADGKRVRFLSPAPSNLPEPAACAPVDCLVFPRYAADASIDLRTLDKMEVLQRLAAVGSSDRPLNERDVAAIVSLAENTRGCELIYENISDALAALDNWIGSQPPAGRVNAQQQSAWSRRPAAEGRAPRPAGTRRNAKS